MGSHPVPICSTIMRDGAKILQDILALVKCNRMEEFSAQKLTSRSYFTGDFSADRLTEVLKITEKQRLTLFSSRKLLRR